MTVFALKIIALITMVLDHIKYAIPVTNCFITKYFGRISFPIFAFLITEGYIHTKSRKKYIGRLLIFALISQIPFMLFRTLVADRLLLNVLFTFLFGIAGIEAYDFFMKNENMPKILKIILTAMSFLVVILLGTIFISVDYGWFGIACVLIFYVFKKSKILTTFSYIILVVAYYLTKIPLNYVSMIFTILPIILILLYNGKEGRKVKYLFYWFYPIHMLLLWVLNQFLV